MASEKSPLRIIRSDSTIDELHSIWRWNCEHFGLSRADEYRRFLTDNIRDLARDYAKGKFVENRSDLRFKVARKKSKSHGHIIVYSFDDQVVYVVGIYHTAQDWQNRLLEDLT